MANTKISALTSAATIVGTEVLPIVQSSATVKVAISNLNPGLSTILATKGGTGQTSYAVGDLLYADTTTTLAKLPDVATGSVLISGGVGVAPSWGKVLQTALSTNVVGNGPAFSAYINTAQTVSNNTLTKMQFNAEEFDTNNNFDSTTNYRFTPTVAGYYQFTASAFVSAGIAAGEFTVWFYKNGVAFKYGNDLTATTTYVIQGSALISLNGSTDYVEVYVYQVSGVSKTLASSDKGNIFQGVLVRAA
jgi:hypothetical protein